MAFDLLAYIKKNHPKNVSSGVGDPILDVGHSKIENAVFAQTNCVLVFALSLMKEIVSSTKGGLFVPLSLIDIADSMYDYTRHLILTRPSVDFIVFGCEITPAVPAFIRTSAVNTHGATSTAFSADASTVGFDTLDPSSAHQYFLGTRLYASENDILAALSDKHTLPLIYSIVFANLLARFSDFAPATKKITIHVVYPLVAFSDGSINPSGPRAPNAILCHPATDNIFAPERGSAVRGSSQRTVLGKDIGGRKVLHESNFAWISDDAITVGEVEQQMMWFMDAQSRKSFNNMEVHTFRGDDDVSVNMLVSPLLYSHGLADLKKTLGLTWVSAARNGSGSGYVNDIVSISGIMNDMHGSDKLIKLVCMLTFLHCKHWNFLDCRIPTDYDEFDLVAYAEKLGLEVDFGFVISDDGGIFFWDQKKFERSTRQIYDKLSLYMFNDESLWKSRVVVTENHDYVPSLMLDEKPYHMDSDLLKRVLREELHINYKSGNDGKVKMIFPTNWDVSHSRQDVMKNDVISNTLPSLDTFTGTVDEQVRFLRAFDESLHVGVFDTFRMRRNQLLFVWFLLYARFGHTPLFSGLAGGKTVTEPVSELLVSVTYGEEDDAQLSNLLRDAGFDIKRESVTGIILDVLPVFEYSSTYGASFRYMDYPNVIVKPRLPFSIDRENLDLVERIFRGCPLFLGVFVEERLKMPSHIDPIGNPLAYLVYRHVMGAMRRLEVVAADKIAFMTQVDPTWFGDLIDVILSETEIADAFTSSIFNAPDSPWVIYTTAVETRKHVASLADNDIPPIPYPVERMETLKKDAIAFVEAQGDLHLIFPNDYLCLLYVYGKTLIGYDEFHIARKSKCSPSSFSGTATRLLHAPLPIIKVAKSDETNKCACFAPISASSLPRRISALETTTTTTKPNVYKTTIGTDTFEYQQEVIMNESGFFNAYTCEAVLPLDQNLSRIDSLASFITPLTVFAAASLASEGVVNYKLVSSEGIVGYKLVSMASYVPHRVMWGMLMDGGANRSDVVRGMAHKLLTRAGVFTDYSFDKDFALSLGKEALESTLSSVQDVCFYALPYLSRDAELSSSATRWDDPKEGLWKVCSIWGGVMQTSWLSLMHWKIAQSIYFRVVNRHFMQEQTRLRLLQEAAGPLLSDVVETSVYNREPKVGKDTISKTVHNEIKLMNDAVARKMKRQEHRHENEVVESVISIKSDVIDRIVSNIVTENVFIYHMSDLSRIETREFAKGRWFSTWAFAFYRYKGVIPSFERRDQLSKLLSDYEVIDQLCKVFPSVDNLYFDLSKEGIDIYFYGWSENIILHYIQHAIFMIDWDGVYPLSDVVDGNSSSREVDPLSIGRGDRADIRDIVVRNKFVVFSVSMGRKSFEVYVSPDVKLQIKFYY